MQKSSRKTLFATGSDRRFLFSHPGVLVLSLCPVHRIRAGAVREMEEAAVVMTGLEIDRMLQGLDILRPGVVAIAWRPRLLDDHDVPVVSEKVVRIIVNSPDFVKKNAWYEPPVR